MTQASASPFTYPPFFSDWDEHMILRGPKRLGLITNAEMRESNHKVITWLSWNLLPPPRE